MPSQPTNVRLFGATPNQQELSRGPLGLRIDFDPAPDADSHAIVLNNVVLPGVFHQGDAVAVGASNTLTEIKVRAVKVGDPPNDSAAFTTVTRAPTPPSAVFVPLELSSLGIVLDWSVPAGFPGAGQSTVIVLRGGANLSSSLSLTSRFIDTSYKLGTPQTYTLRTVIPAVAVPMNILGGPNISFESPAIVVQGPARRITARQSQAFLRRLWNTETTMIRRMGSQ